jgi:ferredoxin-type protein NapF
MQIENSKLIKKSKGSRRFSLAIRFVILVIVIAVAFLSVKGVSPAKKNSADKVILRSEWLAVLPALSPYSASMAAAASRGFTAFTLLGLPVFLICLFKRRWFCRFVCPTGLLLELAGKLDPFGFNITKFPRLAKWIVLVTFAGGIFGFPFFLWLDPLSIFHGLIAFLRLPVTAASAAGASLFFFILVISIIWPGGWCYRICPLGYFQELFNIKQKTAKTDAVSASGNGQGLLTRQNLLLGIAGSFAAGSAFLGQRITGAKREVLRPPGAVDERLFKGLCSRCGNCVRVCPSKIIKPDTGASGTAGLVTPVLTMKSGYCIEGCNECGKVCPTGAIKNLTLSQKNKYVIGIPVIDKDKCWPWKGIRECDNCVTICPLEAIDNFIKSPPMPVVLKEKCNGCGKCEMICPASAIPVKPET